MGKRPDFVSQDGKQGIWVECYDDRGDPHPPNNYRAELRPSTAPYHYAPCCRVDEARKKAREVAEMLGLTQTAESVAREARVKAWATKQFGIHW